MQAWLRASQLWRLVSGDLTRPEKPVKPDPDNDTYTSKDDQWLEKAEKASGWIFLMVEPEQRIHFTGIEDNPVKMWTKLEEVHMAKQAGARFNAYDDLFSIRKKEEESLMSVTNRIDSAVRTIQNLHPKDFTLEKLDEELASMAMIRSLPDDYSSFVSSLLLMDKLEKSTIQQAFHTEETQRRRRSETDESAAALSTSSKSSSKEHCDFCDRDGHTLPKCFKYQKAQKEAKKPRFQNKDKARAAAEQSQDTSKVQETAGRVVSLHTTTTTKTHNDWNADTGATSHMTPHRHWLLDYKPYVVPIKLADNTIVYSAGVGSVVFNPIIEGKQSCPVQFTRVLHVPMLRHNLLSVLFLARQRKFDVHIDAKQIHFILNGNRLFVASINDDNSAFLDGSTVSHSETARISSTLPLNYELWHCHLCTCQS